VYLTDRSKKATQYIASETTNDLKGPTVNVYAISIVGPSTSNVANVPAKHATIRKISLRQSTDKRLNSDDEKLMHRKFIAIKRCWPGEGSDCGLMRRAVIAGSVGCGPEAFLSSSARGQQDCSTLGMDNPSSWP
jgi:hypothetical protein